MPQIIAGTGADLSKTVAQLVKELLENNWPTSAFDPLKADVKFGLDSWDDYGDIQIHVNAGTVTSLPYTLGGDYSKVTDSAVIHLFVRKVQEEIPLNMGNAQRKIEEIIKDNIRNLGQGIPILIFSGWDRVFMDNNLKDIWHAIGGSSATYWKVKV